MARRTVAVAFHSSIAKAKLEELERKDPEQMFGSDMGVCGRCGASFMVIYRNNFVAENVGYLSVLQTKITAECNAGHHTFEVPLKSMC
jgi:hypothetical protein